MKSDEGTMHNKQFPQMVADSDPFLIVFPEANFKVEFIQLAKKHPRFALCSMLSQEGTYNHAESRLKLTKVRRRKEIINA